MAPMLANAQSINELFQQGNVAQATKNYTQAESIWHRVIQQDPNNFSAYLSLGGVLHSQKKLDEAILVYRKAIELNPKYPYTYQFLGNVLVEAKKLDEAIPVYRKAIELNPKYPYTYQSLGKILVEEKKFDEAIALYRQLIKQDPNNSNVAMAYLYLGNTLSQVKKFDEAIAAYQKVSQLLPSDSIGYRSLAIVLKDAHKFDEAIAACRKAIKIAPNELSNSYVLIQVLQASNKFNDGVTLYRKAIELNPNNANFYTILGSVLFSTNIEADISEAIAVYQKAIQLNPSDADAYRGLSKALRVGKNIYDSRSLDVYRKAIQLNPNTAWAYKELGVELEFHYFWSQNNNTYHRKKINPSVGNILLFQQNILNEMSVVFLKLIEFDPKDKNAYESLYSSLYKQGKIDEALDVYRTATQRNPNDAWAYVNLGNALSSQRKLDIAISAYRKAIELNPQTIDTYESLYYVLKQQGKAEEGIAMYRKAIQLNPPYASIYYLSLGNLLERENKLDDAIAAYRMVVQIDSNNANAYANLSNLLNIQGRFDRGTAYHCKAISLNTNNVKPQRQTVAPNQQVYDKDADNQKLDEEIEQYRKLLEENPIDINTLSRLSMALNKREKFDEEITVVQKAILLQSHNADLYKLLGDVIARQYMADQAINADKRDKAINAYNRAIELGDDRIIDQIGNVLFELEAWKEVVKVYRKNVLYFPPGSVGWGRFYEGLVKTNMLNDALDIWQKEIERFPDETRRLYENLYIIGTALMESENLDKALDVFHKILQRYPNNAAVRNSIGDTLNKQKKFDEAITFYNTVLSLQTNKFTYPTVLSLKDQPNIPNKSHPYAYAHNGLGKVFLQQGKLEEAFAKFQHSINIDPDFLEAQKNLEEVQRLRNPQDIIVDDRPYISTEVRDPLVRVKRSTVRVIVEQGQGFGAGWVVKREGNTIWIITNRHVVINDKNQHPLEKIEVEFFSNLPRAKRHHYPTKLEQTTQFGEKLDLAVLKVEGVPEDIKPLEFFLENVSVNTRVTVIGHPYNVDKPDWKSVDGVISEEKNDSKNQILKINADIAQGNSGGPVINRQKQIIGMIFEQESLCENYSQSNEKVGHAYSIGTIFNKINDWRILLPFYSKINYFLYILFVIIFLAIVVIGIIMYIRNN